MNALDFVLLAGGVLVAFYGFMKGFLSFVVKALAVVFTILLVSKFGNLIKEVILQLIDIKPITAGFIGYIIVFILITIVFQIIYVYIKRFIKALDLNIYDRVFGGLVSFILFYVFIVAVLIFLQSILQIDINKYSLIANSQVIRSLFAIVGASIPALNRYF